MAKIGVFDSGVGGLTVLRGLVERFPQYTFCYLADTKNLPYGERTQEELLAFTTQASEFFFHQDCPLVIFACNTASAQALRIIQQTILPAKHPNKKILGVLVPLAEEAVERTRNKKVGVLATTSTVNSGAFIREITKLALDSEVTQQACPKLVELIETGQSQSPEMTSAIQEYIHPLVDVGVDTIILGCTHYSVIAEQIQQHAGSNVIIISAAKIVPTKLENYLHRHNNLAEKLNFEPRSPKKVEFFATTNVPRFNQIGSSIFGGSVRATEISL